MAPRIYAHPWDHQKRDIVDTKTHASRKMGQCGGKKPGSPLLWGKESRMQEKKKKDSPFWKGLLIYFILEGLSLFDIFSWTCCFFLRPWLAPQSHVYFSQAEGLHGGPLSASEEAGEKKGDLCLLFTLISDLTFERSGGVRGRERRREKNKRVRGGKRKYWEERECVCNMK